MRRRLPPLHSLIAFEAVAELGSFTRASEQLALTHSAVSHQVKQLEDFLDTTLLERLPRKVVLTPQGSAYLKEVKAALKLLEQAGTDLAQDSASRPLRISVLASFAGNLLLRELLPYLERNPNMRVEIDATPGLESDESADVDVFIRYDKGEWPGFDSVLLLKVQLFPVCSPDYLQKQGPFETPADLARAVLLRHSKEPWEPWLEFAQETGGSGFERIIPAGPLFSDARLMLDAACDGHGIALARSPLAAADLRSGRLLRVLDIAVDSPQAYRAYMRRRSGLRPSMQQFVEWLQVTCKRFEF